MADSEGTLILRDYLPQYLNTGKALEAFLAQIEKDLQFELNSTLPREVFQQTKKCLEQRAMAGEIMPLLYRVDIDESIATDLLKKDDWEGLTGAVLRRIAKKLSFRFSTGDQK
jgi:hypothetical protein